ncbi:hypothetical protein [Methylocystis sp. Sn-Cys]|uniref:hypothetical protein n=1 Tax=Methylocystis sp. Sn-Cys TaxID=1701263 RepID=UPI001923CFB5|nr:hypothetical protein [Methylocystis sp. Sn-Cys]MBL1258362.1 hypothetical protein [Methylocystis sp. Sn-Cys]
MRSILALVLACAIGAPAAQALPTTGSKALEMSKTETIAQVAKKTRAQPRRQKSGASSGIHPLVGSGGY